MGCMASKPPLTASERYAAAKAKQLKQKKKAKGPEIINQTTSSDIEMNKKKEDILQRHDTEINILHQLSAERATLRAMASVKIEKKFSCEDLILLFNAAELEELHDNPRHYKVQKSKRSALVRKELAEKRRPWVIYNNLEAISDAEISVLGVFLVNLLFTLRKKQGSLPPRLARGSSEDETKSTDERDAAQRHHHQLANSAASPAALVGIAAQGNKNNSNSPKKKKQLSKEEMEQSIRQLVVMNMAPESYYQISSANMYDFELPPGIVTMNEVKLIIELYRRGGKLVPRSVHKLIRLSYKLIKDRPNVSKVNITEKDKLVIVGDLHGQLADLLHILDDAGLPSQTNKYIFNGDFVDRGEWGVEIMCILLAMLVARPDCVFLNRGNHEDYAICSVYGFQVECYEKYDPMTFGMFVEIFQHIPLFAIVNNSIFVVHGGLFHTADARVHELNEIARDTFSLEDIPELGEDMEAAARTNPGAFLKQLVRDALWSDPIDMKGMHPSVRGAGIGFGPDITKTFLDSNKLQFVVRSHECVRAGYDEPYTAEPHPILCTIFSASDYGGSGNSAAYLEFKYNPTIAHEMKSRAERANSLVRTSRAASQASLLPLNDSSSNLQAHNNTTTTDNNKPVNTSELKLVNNTDLYYQVHYFFATPLKYDVPTSAKTSTKHNANMDLANMGGESSSKGYGNDEDLSLSVKEVNHDDDEDDDEMGENIFLTEKINPASMTINPKRNILVGTPNSIEELIWNRKQLLMEAFDKQYHLETGKEVPANLPNNGNVTIEGEEEVRSITYKEWTRIMSEVLNVSIAWRKFAKQLLRDEDKIVEATASHHAANNNPMPTSMNPAVANNFRVKYMSFLGRFDDETTTFIKRMEAEATKSTMGSLQRYLDSIQQVSTSVRNPDDVQVDIMTEEEKNALKFYRGYTIAEDVIRLLYINHHQIEQAFDFFDRDHDGFFSLADFRAGCIELGLVDPDNFSSSKAHSTSQYIQAMGGIGTVDETLIMSIMDIHESDSVGLNLFFEMCRLSFLNTLNPDDAASKSQLARELSFNHEMHRLSHAGSMSVYNMGGGPGAATSPMGHHTHQNTFSTVEIKKGVEIGVDAELATRKPATPESVGLSIDI